MGIQIMQELIKKLEKWAKKNTSYEVSDNNQSSDEYNRGFDDGFICASRDALHLIKKAYKLPEPD